MTEARTYIQSLFNKTGIDIAATRQPLFDAFTSDENNIEAVAQIIETKKMLTEKWKISNRVEDIRLQAVSIPNGTVGKQYYAHLDFTKLGWTDIAFAEIEDIDSLGLRYNGQHQIIEGIPLESGDKKLNLRFRIQGEPEDSTLHIKTLPIVINPNPRSLWKNIPSDQADIYWKKDDEGSFAQLGDRHIVAASRRGRSHANTGGFREDDYAFEHLADTGWSIVAVADGAGSSRLSRKGSRLACNTTVDYFRNSLTPALSVEFDEILEGYQSAANEENQKKLSVFIYTNLSKAAKAVHDELVSFSREAGIELRDIYTTLVFCLIKKCKPGYAILSFGVGDCPMAVISKDLTKVTLMNWLDVGEFGGGTRFISMPDIFSAEKFSTRFRFTLIDNFSYIFLMTDGIYDPKFSVEANLEKIENWKAFITDLNGNNEDKRTVDLKPGNPEIVQQLESWMDFWSQGNHDDRTLCIIF